MVRFFINQYAIYGVSVRFVLYVGNSMLVCAGMAGGSGVRGYVVEKKKREVGYLAESFFVTEGFLLHHICRHLCVASSFLEVGCCLFGFILTMIYH